MKKKKKKKNHLLRFENPVRQQCFTQFPEQRLLVLYRNSLLIYVKLRVGLFFIQTKVAYFRHSPFTLRHIQSIFLNPKKKYMERGVPLCFNFNVTFVIFRELLLSIAQQHCPSHPHSAPWYFVLNILYIQSDCGFNLFPHLSAAVLSWKAQHYK